MASGLRAVLERDARYEGVRRIHIYLMRLVFTLMFFVLGGQCWAQLLRHQGPWDPYKSLALCVWIGFAMVAGLGIVHPVKMVPILLLEIFYKVLWLVVVAYPLWRVGALAGSPTDAIAAPLLWVPLPIVATPWGYVWRTYFSWRKS